MNGGVFLKKVSTYIWERLPIYLVAVLCLFAGVWLDMLSPQLTKQIVDKVIGEGNLSLLKYLLAGILAIGLGEPIP